MTVILIKELAVERAANDSNKATMCLSPFFHPSASFLLPFLKFICVHNTILNEYITPIKK